MPGISGTEQGGRSHPLKHPVHTLNMKNQICINSCFVLRRVGFLALLGLRVLFPTGITGLQLRTWVPVLTPLPLDWRHMEVTIAQHRHL